MRLLFLSLLAISLSACGVILEGNLQDITLLTPGAEHAQCTLHNRDFKVDMWSGETRGILRSDLDLNVDCYASDNRERSIIVKPVISEETQYNVANLGLGAIYDAMDNSFFAYPNVIVVNFEGVAPSSYGLPQHYSDNLGRISPAATYLGPTVPLVGSERGIYNPPLTKKGESASVSDTIINE